MAIPDIALGSLLDCRSHSADVTPTQGPASKPRVLITQTLGTLLTRAACTNLSRSASCWGILVRDGADGVVAPAVLADLVRMRSDDDLAETLQNKERHWSG